MKVGNRKHDSFLEYQKLLDDILKASEMFYVETGLRADYIELTNNQYDLIDKHIPVSTWKFDMESGEFKPKIAGLDVVIKD